MENYTTGKVETVKENSTVFTNIKLNVFRFSYQSSDNDNGTDVRKR